MLVDRDASRPLVEREPVPACPLCGSAESDSFFARADVVLCHACDLLFVSPRPTDSAIAHFYSRQGHYDHWADEKGRTAMWQRRLARVRARVPSGRLLDVGTGQGDFGAEASAHFDFEATEISAEGVRFARTRHGLTVHEGDLLELDLPPDTYDAVTLWHVLEHVARPRDLVQRCKELLRPGGVLFIAVPNADVDLQLTRRLLDATFQFAVGRPPRLSVYIPALDHALSILKGRMPPRDLSIPRLLLEDHREEIHLTHFTQRTLTRLIEVAGLEVIESGIDDHSPDEGWKARVQHRLETVAWQATGYAAAHAILAVARKGP